MKEFLSQKGVKYTDYDVSTDAHARDEMVAKSGMMAVPVVVVGDEVVVGFNRDRLEALL